MFSTAFTVKTPQLACDGVVDLWGVWPLFKIFTPRWMQYRVIMARNLSGAEKCEITFYLEYCSDIATSEHNDFKACISSVPSESLSNRYCRYWNWHIYIIFAPTLYGMFQQDILRWYDNTVTRQAVRARRWYINSVISHNSPRLATLVGLGWGSLTRWLISLSWTLLILEKILSYLTADNCRIRTWYPIRTYYFIVEYDCK